MRRVDFGDRTVIPFATSQGSPSGLSGRYLKEAARGSWFQHIAIEVPGEGAKTKWMESVASSELEKLDRKPAP